MSVALDSDKLRKLIDEFLAETGVFGCTETRVCIGVIGRKQIHLVVTTEGEETDHHERYRCVTKAKK